MLGELGWASEHIEVVVGWFASLLFFAYLIGRRLSKLENKDESLEKAVKEVSASNAVLSTAVAALTNNVNGHTGNYALSEAIKSLTASLTSMSDRIGANEKTLGAHDIQLARLNEMRGFFEQRMTDFYDRRWDPMVHEVQSLATAVQQMNTTISRMKGDT